MNEKEQSMRRLQSLQFAVIELSLYLDTHPDNAEALSAHKKLSEQAQRAKEDYEQHFGALTLFTAGSGEYWEPVASPFPWEC